MADHLVGQLHKVHALLATGTDPNCMEEHENSPLHYAASYGHEMIVDELMSARANVDSRNNFGFSPLHLAADSAHLSCVEGLLDRNANPNLTDLKGRTPLYFAALRGSRKGVQLLLSGAADPFLAANDGKTPEDVSKGEARRAISKWKTERSKERRKHVVAERARAGENKAEKKGGKAAALGEDLVENAEQVEAEHVDLLESIAVWLDSRQRVCKRLEGSLDKAWGNLEGSAEKSWKSLELSADKAWKNLELSPSRRLAMQCSSKGGIRAGPECAPAAKDGSSTFGGAFDTIPSASVGGRGSTGRGRGSDGGRSTTSTVEPTGRTKSEAIPILKSFSIIRKARRQRQRRGDSRRGGGDDSTNGSLPASLLAFGDTHTLLGTSGPNV